jgi:hypothetical protein
LLNIHMTTTRELITGALRQIGVVQVNETPTAADMQISLEALQGLIDSWSSQRLYVYNLNPRYFKFIPGKKTYSVGPGGDWAIPRPMDILKMSVRYLPQGSDPAPAPPPPPPEPPVYSTYLAVAVFNGFTSNSQYGAMLPDFSNYASIGPGFNQSVQLAQISDNPVWVPETWAIQYNTFSGTELTQPTIKFSDGQLVPRELGQSVSAETLATGQPSLTQMTGWFPATADDRVFLRSNSYGPGGDPVVGGVNRTFEFVVVIGPSAFEGDLYRLSSTVDGSSPGTITAERMPLEDYELYGVTARGVTPEPEPEPEPDPAILLNQQGAVDIPMEQLAFDQYAAITVKNTTSQFPLKYYDDAGSPERTITVWPIPVQEHWAVCWFWEPIIDFEDLDQEFELPPGYFRALRASLAVELADEFGRAVPPDVQRIAVQARATIKRLNSQPPILRGSTAIASSKSSLFNYIVGDTVGGTGLL